MALVYYTAKARDGRTIELPESARALGLRAGDEVSIAVDQKMNGSKPGIATGDDAIAILLQIAEHHKGTRITDHQSTQRLINEARGGGAYGYEPTK